MRSKKTYLPYLLLLIISVVLFCFGLFSHKLSFYSFRQYTLYKRFQEDLYTKEFQLDDLMKEWEREFEHFNEKDFFSGFIEKQLYEISKQGILLFVYRNDSLRFWSDNTIPVGLYYDEWLFKDPAFFLSNGWFMKKERVFSRVRVIGLVLIKREYSYENKFLKNEFNRDFWLPPATKIIRAPESLQDSARKEATMFPVYNSLGDYLFSLDFSNIQKYSRVHLYFSLLFYLAGIVLFLISLRYILKAIKDQKRKNIGLLLFFIILILLNIILVKIKMPPNLASLTLFSPTKFAASNLISSLGGLLITSFFIFYFSYNLYREFDLPGSFLRGKRKIKQALMLFFILLLAMYYEFVITVSYSLIIHSSINFETYQVLNLSIYTFIGLLIIVFLFTALALGIDKFIVIFRPRPSLRNLLVYSISFGVLTGLGSLFISVSVDPVIIVFGILIVIVIAVIRYRKNFHYTYSTFVLLALLFSILTVYQIVVNSLKKEKDTMKVLAIDISAEHDPVAELLLDEMEDSIASDTVLASLIHDIYIDNQTIYDYLIRKYFNGFWEKYDLQFTICSPYDSVYVGLPDNRTYYCYQFFDDLLSSSGIRIPDSKYYFIDNKSGRISYFAPFEYYSADNLNVYTMFLELDSKTISSGLGYPELLLSERFGKILSDEYSYAKYYKNELITQAGSYSYSLRSNIYTMSRSEFEFKRLDGYHHLVYNIDDENSIILSHPQLKILDVLITFTYIFVFFYLLTTISLLIVNMPFFQRIFLLNIKNKIQYSMIIVLVFSLLMIGSGTIYFSARQYRQRHYENLSDKIQSVYVELLHILAFETMLGTDWQSEDYLSLDELLQKFSNVFYTDINLYNPEGDLLATSRPEIFQRGLQGEKMHPLAYAELVIKSRNEYVHEENIGSMKYLSAYVPFKNNENKLLAFLNLPYFTKQGVLAGEISNLVVAILNFYVFLITISILLAVFLSNKITQPLRMIQERFSTFTLGKTEEKISYDAEDEIGSLVKEYNHMVEELAKSAELLARSERESAWREMAKQIAHEINNPLTPMKLSVQHLQKVVKDENREWGKNIKRITETLIEQIDELSAIATEFSNFAKMPKADNIKLDLRERINDIMSLFSNTEGITFETVHESDRATYIYADKEQISRVFINLIKNAVQSIPDERKGMIQIKMQTTDKHAVVKVSDNGRGIPEELGDKLFQPNFTTKSGGMGMGLAIVKSIVENAYGEISYQTIPGKGTTFIVKLPLFEG